MRKVLPRLLKANAISRNATRGDNTELVGVLLELRNARARLSRTETRGKPFSCLGELLWYLSRDNRLDFITNYIPRYEAESEDKETVYGGYGPRIFDQRGHDQLQNVMDLLEKNPGSRRAVIQIFNAEDIDRRHREVPCTCTLQFLARDGKLHMLTNMRSNDVYKGLPHDVFCFTMLQEIVARALGLNLGLYKHFAGSLHLYDIDRDAAQQYLDEGIQSTVVMPSMPKGNPWPAIEKVLDAEKRIRNGLPVGLDNWKVDDYWADLIRLLQILAATGDAPKIEEIEAKMVYGRYSPYIAARKTMERRTIHPDRQFAFPF